MLEDHQAQGFDLAELSGNDAFLHRAPRAHDYRAECNAIYLIGTALTSSTPERLPQLLCDAARDVCGAESTGISLEETSRDGMRSMYWAAASGPFLSLLDQVTPRSGSPCGACLDRDTPQLVAVHQAYYDRLGIRGAPLVAQAILIPWHVQGVNGTFWAMHHTPGRDFDPDDLLLLQHLASFASIAMRHLQQQASARPDSAPLASARLADELASRVHNPLQAAINSLYLANRNPGQASSYVASAIRQMVRISDAVEETFSRHARHSAHKLAGPHT